MSIVSWIAFSGMWHQFMMAKHGTVEHKNGIPLQDKDRMDADLLLPAIFCIICQPLILNMTICIHILRLANQISCLS